MIQAKSPILFLIFNRPEATRQTFASIRQAQPSQLFIAADGARDHVLGEQQRCQATREIVSQVDWDCDLRILFREKNLGCKSAVETAISWFFEHVEQGIILEDDCLPDPSFYPYCDQLLERYNATSKVMAITGDNFHQCCFRAAESYYFSKYMHCWGWATWRRAWSCYQVSMSGSSDDEVIHKFPTSSSEVRYWKKRFNKVRSGRINTWDLGWQHSIWRNGGLTITPQVNLVKNIGFGVDSTHTANGGSAEKLVALSLTIKTHPSKIEQDRLADQHLAEHVLGIGTRTVWTRIKREFNKVFRRSA